MKQISSDIKFFWVGEETEIYAARNVNEVLDNYYSEKEREELIELNLFGEILKEDLPAKVRDDETGEMISIEEIIPESTKNLPALLLTAYA